MYYSPCVLCVCDRSLCSPKLQFRMAIKSAFGYFCARCISARSAFNLSNACAVCLCVWRDQPQHRQYIQVNRNHLSILNGNGVLSLSFGHDWLCGYMCLVSVPAAHIYAILIYLYGSNFNNNKKNY